MTSIFRTFAVDRTNPSFNRSRLSKNNNHFRESFFAVARYLPNIVDLNVDRACEFSQPDLQTFGRGRCPIRTAQDNGLCKRNGAQSLSSGVLFQFNAWR
jgi:hypothetical protein